MRFASARSSRTSEWMISPSSLLSVRFSRAHSRYVFERSTLVVRMPAAAP
jgi:hypothetical protein